MNDSMLIEKISKLEEAVKIHAGTIGVVLQRTASLCKPEPPAVVQPDNQTANGPILSDVTCRLAVLTAEVNELTIKLNQLLDRADF